MNTAPVDLRDIPQIGLRKIREVTQKFALMQVEDFSAAGDSSGPEYSWNTISPAILYRDNYSCRVCGKAKFERVRSEKEFNKIHFSLQVHHIIPRKENGKSNFRNLITLCEDCHHRTFRNGYSGIPIIENATLYDFNESVTVAVPPEMIPVEPEEIRAVTLREVARAFDQNTSQYRVFRHEDSSMAFHFPLLTRKNFLTVFRDLTDRGLVSDYVTLTGVSSRREIPVRVFTDSGGSIVLW